MRTTNPLRQWVEKARAPHQKPQHHDAKQHKVRRNRMAPHGHELGLTQPRSSRKRSGNNSAQLIHLTRKTCSNHHEMFSQRDKVHTDEKDRRKLVLRDNWQSNFRYSSKNDFIKTEKCLDLLTEKGVYPYDYVNSFDKFNDEHLPSKEQFYSRLIE